MHFLHIPSCSNATTFLPRITLSLLTNLPTTAHTTGSSLSLSLSLSRTKQTGFTESSQSIPQPMASTFKSDTIYISGLDSSISEDVLRNEVFATAGTILNITMNYDRFGKSTGSATIRFQSSQQAIAAAAEWNHAVVDGKEMTVQLVGSHVKPVTIQKATPPATTRPPVARAPAAERAPRDTRPAPRREPRGPAAPAFAPRQPQSRVPRDSRDSRPSLRRDGHAITPHDTRGPRSTVPPRRSAPPKKAVTAADLDAQLDKYNAAREAAAKAQ